MQRLSVYLSLLILILSLGCARDSLVSTIDLPTLPKQPAVIALLSPGDSVQVSLTWPVGLNELVSGGIAPVNNATVTIENNQTKQQVALSVIRAGIYSISQRKFSIEAGQTYWVRARIPGLPEASAQCTVPAEAASIRSISEGQTRQVSNNDYLSHEFFLSWNDVSPLSYYLLSSRNVTRNESWVLSAGVLNEPRNGNFINCKTSVGHDKPGAFTVQWVLLTVDKHVADLYTQLGQTRDLSQADLTATILSNRGILPRISNVTNGVGVVGAYLRTERTSIFRQ